MLPTLQWYIFREMGKTFVLTAIGLTAVLGLGGGVMNLVEHDRVTPSHLIRLMLIVLPMAGSLTLPIAALFSATVTYGRLSADNELVACRSSGINVHRLFLPTLTLSLLVAACTFYFTSFLVPGLFRELQNLSQVDMRQLVVQQLDSPKRLQLSDVPVKFYADHAVALKDSEAIALGGVVFLKVDKERSAYTQYGTAESIVIRFSRTEDGRIAVDGEGLNATVFDEQGVADARVQRFGPEVIAREVRTKVKLLDLAELIHYRRCPEEWPKIAADLDKVRSAIACGAWYARLRDRLAAESEFTLSDDRTETMLRAELQPVDTGRDKLLLRSVSVVETRDGQTRRIVGDRAEVTVSKPADGESYSVVIRIEGNVATTTADGLVERKGEERLAGIALAGPAAEGDGALPDATLLDPSKGRLLAADATEMHAELLRDAAKFTRRVTSELHSRLAFSTSVFVLVILGAALGVVFRGSHVLVAFGISFVPAIFVIVMNIMGRQLAEKDGTVLMGLCTIWGSILIVAAVDFWTLARGVRR